MYCGNCGKEIADEATFCPECGQKATTSLDESSDDVDEAIVVSKTTASPNTIVEGAPSTSSGTAEPGKKPRMKTIVIIIAAIVVVCGIVGGLWWKGDQDVKAAQAAAEQAAWDAAHIKHAVVLNVSAPGYDAATCSPIPVHITGTDLDGNKVDQVQYVDESSKNVQLMQGNYNVQAAASPLLAGGGIYDTPATVIVVEIPADLNESATVNVPTDQVITFTPIDAVDITDDQIATAKKYALDSGMDQTKVDALATAATNARNTAVAQKQAEEAAAAAEAQRQAELKAARHVETDYFSFDVPESWAGNFSLTQDNKQNANGGWSRFWDWKSGNDTTFEAVVWTYPGKLEGNAGVTSKVSDMGTCSFDSSIKVCVIYPYRSVGNMVVTDAQRADSDYIVSTFRVK